MPFILTICVLLMLGVLGLTVWAISKGYKHEKDNSEDGFEK